MKSDWRKGPLAPKDSHGLCLGAFLGHVSGLPTEQTEAIIQEMLLLLGHQLPIFPEFPGQIGGSSWAFGYLGLGLGVQDPSGFGFALWVSFA